MKDTAPSRPVAARARQVSLWGEEGTGEAPDFLSRQLITYIGNKRALIGHIGRAVERVKRRLGKERASGRSMSLVVLGWFLDS